MDQHVAIVGAGIMGVTLATLLKSIESKVKITLFEQASEAATGNSAAFNNAGTGHEANCEFNYTPVDKSTINIQKAIDIHAQFNIAKQFWSYLVKNNIIDNHKQFINYVKHITVVTNDDIDELKERHTQMSSHHFFSSMAYSDNREQLKKWIPLIIEQLPEDIKIAATMIESGTDIDYEALTKHMLQHLINTHGVQIHYNTKVKRVKRKGDTWHLKVTQNKKSKTYHSDKVFIGAGGNTFPLLKQSKLTQAKQYAGFPVGGYFLSTEVDNQLANTYQAKAYGKAKIGAPPMSVPHLDIRHIQGKKYLLFGPFATFSCRLEKGGSISSYFSSIKFHDVLNLIKVARHNFTLLIYLIKETLKNKTAMLAVLDEFAPKISTKFNWQLMRAGQRVQVIKQGELNMGTEMVYSEDHSFSALLGASPGASVSPTIMLSWLKTAMPELAQKYQDKLDEIFPAADISTLSKNKEIYEKITTEINQQLGYT